MKKTTKKPVDTSPKIPLRAAVKELALFLEPLVAAEGFTPPKRKTNHALVQFSRDCGKGITQSVWLQSKRSGHVALYVTVHHAELGARIATLLKGDEQVSLVNTSLTNALAGSDKTPDEEYAVCHRHCLDRAQVDLKRDLKLAWAFLGRVRTLDAVDKLYDSPPDRDPSNLWFGIEPTWAKVAAALAITQNRRDKDKRIASYRRAIKKWHDASERRESLRDFDSIVNGLTDERPTGK